MQTKSRLSRRLRAVSASVRGLIDAVAQVGARRVAWLKKTHRLHLAFHERQKELMRAARSERQAGIQASRGAMAHMRREEVKVLRQMRHENEGAVQAQRAFEHGRAVQRKAMVKEQQRLAAERKAKEREAALTRLKAEREAKQSLLGKDASDQVRDFERMEEEERRLIASLQATQAQQQAAYSELEGVLGSAQASRVR